MAQNELETVQDLRTTIAGLRRELEVTRPQLDQAEKNLQEQRGKRRQQDLAQQELLARQKTLAEIKSGRRG